MAESAGPSPGRIFISYRQEETAYAAGWLFDRLADRFGRQVFKDVDSIEPGENWVEVITRVVGSCDALLALIGNEWLIMTDDDGRRRLDDPDDFVRLEIEAALKRNIRVIPILVAGARMPRATELPSSLAGLTQRQAHVLSPANFDTSPLLRVLDKVLAEVRTQHGAAAISAPAEKTPDRSATELLEAAPNPDTDEAGPPLDEIGSVGRMAVFRSPVMVGRDRELDRLRQIAAAVDSAEPAFVVIEGEPGVGKTRLAAELAGTLDSALVLTGHGMALPSGELPFGVLSELLRGLARTAGAAVIRPLLADEARALAGLVPAFAADGVVVGPVDRVAVFGATAGLLQRLAEDRLVVVFIDDLQWVDDESLDVLEYVGRVVQDCRVLFLTTVRTGDAAGDQFAERLAGLHRLPCREVIVLARLSGGEVAEQVRHLLGPHIDAATVSRIWRLSEGVPFLAEELVASGVTAERTLPASVRRLVLARLPELAAEARNILDAVAIGEGHTEHRLLVRVTGMGGSRFDAATTQAMEAGVLEVTEDGLGYRFRHALLREALDQAMHPSARIHWHREWARTLSETHAPLSAAETAILTAQHWHAVGDADEAHRSAIAAARASAQLAAPKQEAEFWQRVFALWPADREQVDGVSKGEVVVRLLRAREFASQLGEALSWFGTTLRARVNDSDLELCLRVLEEYCADLAGVPDIRLATADSVSDLIERLAAMGCSWPAMDAIHCLWHQFPERQAQLFDRVDGLLDLMSADVGDEHTIRAVMGHRAWFALQNGRADDALRRTADQLDHARNSAPMELHFAEANLMVVLLAQGRAAEAVDFGTEAMRSFTEPDAAPVPWSRLALELGRGLLALGRYDQVRQLVDRAGHLTAKDRVLRRTVVPLQIRVAARLGDLLTATQMLEDLASEAGAVGPEDMIWTWHWSWSCLVSTDMAFASGDLSRLESMRPLLSQWWLVRSSDWTWEVILNALRVMLCPLSGSPGEIDDALAIAEVADRLHRHGRLGQAWSLEVVALRGRGTETDSTDDWSAAAEAWLDIGYQFDEAVCRLRLAEALLREGRRERATEQLTNALRLAHALNAKPLTEAVRRTARIARLRLHGDTPASRSGPAGLTERETEVLALVARGRTNEQIGSELFISPKTASVHVSRIISKLGAANRTEATALARNLGLVE